VANLYILLLPKFCQKFSVVAGEQGAKRAEIYGGFIPCMGLAEIMAEAPHPSGHDSIPDAYALECGPSTCQVPDTMGHPVNGLMNMSDNKGKAINRFNEAKMNALLEGAPKRTVGRSDNFTIARVSGLTSVMKRVKGTHYGALVHLKTAISGKGNAFFIAIPQRVVDAHNRGADWGLLCMAHGVVVAHYGNRKQAINSVRHSGNTPNDDTYASKQAKKSGKVAVMSKWCVHCTKAHADVESNDC
jgi:hypothetical protein